MQKAKAFIRKIVSSPNITTVISGGCHLGGIDIWAEEIADELGKGKLIFKPKVRTWDGGYKERNIKIAENSDEVYCITVNSLPSTYYGMRFPICYHCARAGRPTDHIKSGGCWTVIRAIKLGKTGYWKVIEN